MKPIPSKTDILADLHRLKILIGKKYISDVDKLSMRYFHILNKMICAHPKNFQNFKVDEIAAEVLRENHHKESEIFSPLRY